MILRNARLVGADGARQDIVIDGGAVRWIGEQYRPDQGRAHGHREIDLEGRYLMRGLWDRHVHMSQWALARRRIDVTSATSAAEAAELIRRALPADTDATVVAAGFQDGLWPDSPVAEVLDAVSVSHAIVVISHDLHAIWLNSTALSRYGATGDGMLREAPAFAITSEVARAPDRLLDAYVAEASQAAIRRGVVGICDYEMGWNFADWVRRTEAGSVPHRVLAGVYPPYLGRVDSITRSFSPMLRTEYAKVLIDGSLNTRTAYCHDPYPGGGHGVLTASPGDLDDLLTRIAEVELEPAIHAIGDHAVQVALDALARRRFTRPTIEHAQLVSGADLARFAQLGVTASVQPEHAMDDRDVAEHYWPGRTARAFPFRSLIDAGAELALGSDAPVAPLNPWIAISAAVTRSRDDREPWHREQAITVGEALAASVRSAESPGSGKEHRFGAQPGDGGKLGDGGRPGFGARPDDGELIVLDADPTRLAPDVLRAMPVAATIVGGELVYSAFTDV